MFDRESTMESISKCMAETMKQKNIKAIELSVRTGITAAAISQILAKNRCPTISLLMKICFVLGVPIGTMIGYDNSEMGEATNEASRITEQINDLITKREKLLTIKGNS